MRVVLLGGSGFIGRALTQALISRGDEVVVPTRHVPAITSPAGPKYQLWDGQDHSSLSQILNRADAVVNLLGENIAAKRWSHGQKERILSSRLLAGQALVIALQLPNDFVQSLGRALKSPVWIPIPSPLLRLVFGDMADELLLAGQKVSPTRLLEHGFTFRRPTLNSALPL